MHMTGLILDPLQNLPPLKPEAAYIFQEAFSRGNIARGEISQGSALAE
jgi:hypothetical protein